MLGTAGAGTNITNTDIYGTAATDAAGTTAYYYNFKIDYMISTTSKDKLKIGVDNVKVTGKDTYTSTTEGSTTTNEETVDVVIAGSYASGDYIYGTDGAVTKATSAGTATAGEDVATLDKATRVAFIDATSYTSSTDGDKVEYTISNTNKGTEYAIASTCTTTDHNYKALQELGYAPTDSKSEYTNYDQGQTVLSTTSFHSVKTPAGTEEAPTKTTKDGSFTYGSVDVYVWFDGTDKACTNAIFSQKVTFDLKFTIGDTVINY